VAFLVFYIPCYCYFELLVAFFFSLYLRSCVGLLGSVLVLDCFACSVGVVFILFCFLVFGEKCIKNRIFYDGVVVTKVLVLFAEVREVESL
jgi:hypothetical protein